MFAVTVNEGPLTAEDNAVYVCDQEPVHHLYIATVKDDPSETHKYLAYLEFTPSNGYRKGKLHRVPRERVVSIVAEHTESGP